MNHFTLPSLDDIIFLRKTFGVEVTSLGWKLEANVFLQQTMTKVMVFTLWHLNERLLCYIT